MGEMFVMMRTDYMDEAGRQIPVEFDEKGIFSRTVSRIRKYI